MTIKEHFSVQFLRRFDAYPFLIKMGEKEYLIGEGGPAFTVVMKEPIAKEALMESTSIALGEAYMDGNLEIEGDLFQALDCFLGQMAKFSTDQSVLKKLIFSPHSVKREKKDIADHYDIGNDFYRLWLDETMSYSCGYFKECDDTLYKAQVNKVDYILEKLYLKPGMSLLDIGCGWGFLLMEAAKKYGIRGTGITLSEEQKKKFEERIQEEGLQEQLSVELMDYQMLQKTGYQFDRVVSVGMLEHVGREHYELFFKNVDAVLKEGGLCLLHFISALKEYPGDPWIKKYIFPGGVIPSLREIVQLCGEHQYYVLDVESLRRHYYQTLRCWSENFRRNRAEVEKNMGTKFYRMWDLYLCACAATFHNGIIDLDQILMSKGVNNELPMTRWY